MLNICFSFTQTAHKSICSIFQIDFDGDGFVL